MEFAIQAGRRQDDYREMIVATGFEDVTIGDCRLILGDCREVLPTLPQVDLVLTDPPYGIGRDEKYFDIACERIDNAYRQGRMFQDKPEPMKQKELIA